MMKMSKKSEKSDSVRESAGGPVKNDKTGSLLTEIVTRPGRIKEKTDENFYPPESAIRPEFIRLGKKAEADIRKGKGRSTIPLMIFF